MSFAVAAVAAVGVGVSIYSQISSANDQADLDRTRARIARQQADELEKRNQANALLIEQQAYRQKLQFGASYAASGKAGTGVGSQLQIQHQADEANMIATSEAHFQESMLQQQAGIDTSLSGQAETAGTLGAIATGLQGVGTIGRGATAGGKNPGYGAPGQGMGSYPTMPSYPALTAPQLGAGAYGGG